MTIKTQIINALDDLPENLSIDQVIDRIIFMDKVQKGLDDSENKCFKFCDELIFN